MTRFRFAALQLVKQEGLLTVLPLVVLTADKPSLEAQKSRVITRAEDRAVIAAIVKVLSTLWSTLTTQVTGHKSSKMTDVKEEDLPEEPDSEYTSEDMKRKRNNSSEQSNKKAKKNYDHEFHGMDANEITPSNKKARNNSDHELDGMDADEDTMDSTSAKSSEKVGMPISVPELLSCVTLLTPTVIASASEVTMAQHLGLVAELLQYIGELMQQYKEEHTFPRVTLDPEEVNQQVSRFFISVIIVQYR